MTDLTINQALGFPSRYELPDRIEFEVETQHHTDKNYSLMMTLKFELLRRDYNCVQCPIDAGTRFTFYKSPGRAPY